MTLRQMIQAEAKRKPGGYPQVRVASGFTLVGVVLITLTLVAAAIIGLCGGILIGVMARLFLIGYAWVG